ncbi:hypothetical protein ONE63_011152 [Megalurothrips usitatus]|uniref:Reverse transcriptase domain-containing protein n=1 Tax=Megalurothrips usitatus TaxID=439358 RepID=A0AAV7XG62_9NEOP|nr:hypothetical protein ONE63_011152 [Megalurothrips usitatus]
MKVTMDLQKDVVYGLLKGFYEKPTGEERQRYQPPDDRLAIGDINVGTTPEVPPPLVLQDKTYFPSLERHLHTLRLQKDFTAKAQGRRVIIQAGSQRDYQKIRAAVEERKLGFHSYPNRAPEDRLKRFVARNLIFSTSLEDIKNDLASKNIHPNQILWKRKGGKLLPLLVIDVANKYAKAVQEVKTICHQIVTIEKEYKSGPPICSRCCSYNHLGWDCQNTYRCMSCLGGHGPQDPCPSKEKPVCRNCHQEGHRAVYKGCKQYRRYTGQEEDAPSTSSSSSSSSDRSVAPGPNNRPPPKNAWQKIAPQQDNKKQGVGEYVVRTLMAVAPLLVLSWNAGSVVGKANHLADLLEDAHPQVVLLQETHLKPHIPTPDTPGYTWYRRDRLTTAKGGGVAILVHDSLHFQVEPSPAGLRQAEVVGGLVSSPAGDLYVASVYLPPSKGRKGDIHKILTHRPHFFIGGDLNAHWTAWGGDKDSDVGRYLDHYINELRLNIHIPATYTRIDPRIQGRDAVLDYGISHQLLTEVDIEVLPHVFSDHRPVVFSLNQLNTFTPPEYRTVRDWEGIRAALQSVAWPDQVTHTSEGVNDAAEVLEAEIQAILINHSHTVRVKSRHKRLLPKQIRQLKQQRSQLHKQFLASRSQNTKLQLNQLDRRIAAEIRGWKEERLLQDITDLDDTTTRWKSLKRLNARQTRITTLTSADGSPAYTDGAKANLIAQSLAERFTEHVTGVEDSEVARFQIPRRAGAAPRIQKEHVEAAFRSSKDNKAAGHDGIDYKMLKCLSPAGRDFLLKLFNAVISSQVYPDAWKRAVVIPLPKEGKDPHQPGNYRPISLTPCVSKIFEKSLLPLLVNIERRLKVVPDYQMGFRAHHSTTQQLTRISEYLLTGWNSKRVSIMVALDVEAAFDRVPHRHLLFKMSKAGYPQWVLALLSSYFSNRSFIVRVGEEVSAPYPIKAGTPQGAILSPFLYNNFISDMPTPTEGRGITCQYADDTCYVTQDKDETTARTYMETTLARLDRWCSRWKTKINAGKSTVMIIGPTADGSDPSLTIKGNRIPVVENCRYLGVHYDNNMTFQAHIRDLKSRVIARTAQLDGLAIPLGRCSEQTRQTLYEALIRPIITYGTPSWLGVADTWKEIIYIQERRWIRKIHKIPKYVKKEHVYTAANFPPLQHFLDTQAQNFRDKCWQHANPLVSQIGKYEGIQLTRRPSYWKKRLPLQHLPP